MLGLFRRQREARYQAEQKLASAQEWADREAYASNMAQAGWRRYEWTPPPEGQTVQMHRYEWAESSFCTRESLHPAMNVANLWWRPVQHDIELSPPQIC